MMIFSPKRSLLALALALAVPGASFAALNMDTGVGDGGIYANEIQIGGGGAILNSGAAADHTATVLFGASFATDAWGYVRFDLGGATFAQPVNAADFTVQDSVPASALVSVAQGGATGDNYVIFAVAPSIANQNLVGGNPATFNLSLGAHQGVKATAKPVTLRYRLFETLTNAANQTLPLKDKGPLPWLKFENALAITAVTPATATADVSAVNGAYTDFTPTGPKPLAAFDVTHTPRALPSGVASEGAANFLTDTNSVSISGDFSWTGAAANTVELQDRVEPGVCVTPPGGGIASATHTATGATFTVTAAQLVPTNIWYVCAHPSTTTAIPAGDYTGTVDLVGQAGFNPADGTTGPGKIERNGTILKVPFISGQGGQYTYVQLANMSTVAAPYTVRCFSPSGAISQGNPGSIPGGNTAKLYMNNLGCPSTANAVEFTLSVPAGRVVGTMVRQNTTTGDSGFSDVTGNQ